MKTRPPSFLTKRLHGLCLQSTQESTPPANMRAAQDWDVVSKGMESVLEQEAKERALNRDAIAKLRRCGETSFFYGHIAVPPHTKNGLPPVTACKHPLRYLRRQLIDGVPAAAPRCFREIDILCP